MPMLDAMDFYNIRQDAHETRVDYREVYLVDPTITTGSNYDSFSDSAYDISQAYATVTYVISRIKARVKIYSDTSLYGLGQVIPGLEIGDYLLYFRDKDADAVERIYYNKDAYIVVDGVIVRPNGTTWNGVGKNFDISVHCKTYAAKFRAPGV